MGCFPSKKDVSDDTPRQRQHPVEIHETKTISTPIKQSLLGDENHAKSHDEYRLLENDAFIKNLKRKEEQEIVKQTTSQMFDLSQLDYINDDELEEKEQIYKEMHAKLNFGRHKPLTLLRLNMKGNDIKGDTNTEDPYMSEFKEKVNVLSESLSSIGVRVDDSLVQIFPSLPSEA